MFKTDGSLFHKLEVGIDDQLPKKFTFPFYYEPHPLCVAAAHEVQQYLKSQSDFKHNFGLVDGAEGLVIGKMFGVMIVKSKNGEIGYLAGFSGKLGEQNFHKGFVPPIFDTLSVSGFYKKGEERLNAMTVQIDALEASEAYRNSKLYLNDLKTQAEKEIKDYKQFLKTQKQLRNDKRFQARKSLKQDELEQFELNLDKESIALHYQLKHMKLKWKDRLEKAENQVSQFENKINQVKEERKRLSGKLQKQLHQSYSFLNANGEQRDLLDIFDVQPPAAAGECAAPKLFQFAYEQQLEPIAMAEFWWGASPKSQVRKHKQFYPACRSKCEPILGHMMKGLDVDENPILNQINYKVELDIIFEDNYLLVVNKPEEVLSVPGKTISDSILNSLKTYLPESKGPILVHRLDMSTSGILIAAKNEKTFKNLQKQFINRTVKKRYIALLDGELTHAKGKIDLPLRVDLDNRPCQLVCYEHGKSAQTEYELIGIEDGKSRVYFYPITGRTHQLRVHAAHQLGLNTPIVGDDLYGAKGKRLHLHAEQITLDHPVKKKKVTFKVPSPF